MPAALPNHYPLRVAVAGLGGFAAAHHAALRELEKEGLCQVVATCDPVYCSGSDPAARFDLQSRGIEVFPTLTEMLDRHAGVLDVVTLPTPIPMHAEQHASVIASGAACYLEKPPTLWWPEFQAMRLNESGAKVPTQIGFNFIGDPMRIAVRNRIISGEFGTVKRVAMLALWPRDRAYYTRNDWAGRKRLNGHPVMDSPIGNAVAHFVQDLFFWSCVAASPLPVAEVGARLIRVHPIENFDTAFVQARLINDVEVRIAATHTGIAPPEDLERVICERATISLPAWNRLRIDHADGRTEEFRSDLVDPNPPLKANLRHYLRVVAGHQVAPVCSLEDAAGFVALCHLAQLAGGEPSAIDEHRCAWDEQSGTVDVDGLYDELRAFALGDSSPEFPTAVRAADHLH